MEIETRHIAATTGGAGDIIYSIPVMRKLNIKLLYVKESFYWPPYGSLYSSIKPLLETQGFLVQPTDGSFPIHHFEPGLEFKYNMDNFRYHGVRGQTHIMKCMLMYGNCSLDNFGSPWLTGFDTTAAVPNYDLIHLTPRWREGSIFDWRKLYVRLMGEGVPVYFVGFNQDHKDFCRRYGKIEKLECLDFLHLTKLIASCRRLYCNQGIALTMAQGLGKEFYCEFKPGKANTRLYTSNENVLYE